MWARLSAFGRSGHGNAGTEFALIVPILIALGAGVVEFGLAYHVFNQTNRLATQYATVWSDCIDTTATACQAELSTYTASATIGNVVPQLKAANVTLQMFQVKMSGANPTVVFAYPTGAALSASQTAAVRKTVADGQTGVVVTVSYAHSFDFFPQVVTQFFGGTVLTPSYTVAQLKT